ncbi:hypothetical protein Lsan_0818 [Legionella santicrucis]|uniref:Uncharacterized protein n=1 Tax=Legionella santicrucis TaxID=45074 RepID=A0A0W0Z932_9GAMM|nr:hypothetical protein [Legionella santicrucis]KTD65427.1 hypothetical protein Lsan_0818 [Legionella santicrucis]
MLVTNIFSIALSAKFYTSLQAPLAQSCTKKSDLDEIKSLLRTTGVEKLDTSFVYFVDAENRGLSRIDQLMQHAYQFCHLA